MPGDSLSVKMMHWNILADSLAHESFSKVPKDYLKWEYRFELMKQHIKSVNPDVIGLSEVDVLPLYREIAEWFNKQGYADYFVEKPNGISGSAIFYKKDKFVCLQQNAIFFSNESSQFFMYCRLAKRMQPGKKGSAKEPVPSTGTSFHDMKM